MTTREEDYVEQLFVTNTLAYLLLFTNKGRVYWTRVYEIPEAGRAAKGKSINPAKRGSIRAGALVLHVGCLAQHLADKGHAFAALRLAAAGAVDHRNRRSAARHMRREVAVGQRIA